MASWLDDLYTLDVGRIVGPPYAILDIEPKIGPITGGTSVIIYGMDFINTPGLFVLGCCLWLKSKLQLLLYDFQL